MRSCKQGGFTLIELSIVLVIIGLIVGGILVGRDLIFAANIRSQISQIDRYQQGVNTFRSKYGYLPGDIPDPDATNFGFIARGPYKGEGDGNGKIEGAFPGVAGTNNAGFNLSGESGLFWADLSTARLIDGSFTAALADTAASGSMSLYLPAAKIRSGKTGGQALIAASGGVLNENFFAVMNATTMNGGVSILWDGKNGIVTPKEAYAVDSKIDDGMPLTGNVVPFFNASGNNYMFILKDTAGGTWTGTPAFFSSVRSGSYNGDSTTCMDNDYDHSMPLVYSYARTDSGLNCTLGFRFK